MMRWSWRTLLLPGIGLVLVVAGIVLINQHATIQYPLGTWRMDLDDALMGVGTILIGAAAIWTVWLKAKEAAAKAEALEKKLNGGLSDMAAQIMVDELRTAGLEINLAERVASVEATLETVTTQRDLCLERVAQQDAIIESIHRRLDQNGVGRHEPR